MTDDRKPRHAAFDARPDSDPALGLIVAVCLCLAVYAAAITTILAWRML